MDDEVPCTSFRHPFVSVRSLPLKLKTVSQSSKDSNLGLHRWLLSAFQHLYSNTFLFQKQLRIMSPSTGFEPALMLGVYPNRTANCAKKVALITKKTKSRVLRRIRT